MKSRLCVRSLVIIVLVVSLVSSYRLSKRHSEADTDPKGTNDEFVARLEVTYKWVNESESAGILDASNSTDEESHRPPKTYNWCGLPRYSGGNGIKDFRNYTQTNACCKDHALSEYIDVAGNVGHECSADYQFNNCLKNVNSTASQIVGNSYFNKFPPRNCFEVERFTQCDEMMETFCTSWLKIYTTIVPRF